MRRRRAQKFFLKFERRGEHLLIKLARKKRSVSGACKLAGAHGASKGDRSGKNLSDSLWLALVFLVFPRLVPASSFLTLLTMNDATPLNEIKDTGTTYGYHGDLRPYAGLLECTRLFYGRIEWTDEDVAGLCEAIDRGALPKLEHLCLYHNQIGDGGAAALVGMVSKLPLLKRLEMEENPNMSQEAKDALMAAFKSALPECNVSI